MNRCKSLIIVTWQGGNLDAYPFGAQLLAAAASGPLETVEVAEPDGSKLPTEDGIVARSILLRQLGSAEQILKRRCRIESSFWLGGDCFVSLAPFAYLNGRYEGDLAILWVDAHPGVMAPQQSAHAHAMVLENLLEEGDPVFTKSVARPVMPEKVMYAGLYDMRLRNAR